VRSANGPAPCAPVPEHLFRLLIALEFFQQRHNPGCVRLLESNRCGKNARLPEGAQALDARQTATSSRTWRLISDRRSSIKARSWEEAARGEERCGFGSAKILSLENANLAQVRELLDIVPAVTSVYVDLLRSQQSGLIVKTQGSHRNIPERARSRSQFA